MTRFSSRLPGFYDLSVADRVKQLTESTNWDSASVDSLTLSGGLSIEQADHMIENVVGIYGLPLGVATNFIVNEKEVLVPMVVEEPSVVAGASFMAKLARDGGGFVAETTEPEMIGQIQILDIGNLEEASGQILANKDRILAEADAVDPVLTGLGGGARDIEVRIIKSSPSGEMLIAHLIFDTRDAMGANSVNTAVERISPLIEEITGGRTHLRILTNLADRRLAKAVCRIPCESLAYGEYSGERVRDGIVEAYAFAAVDPYRAATHNKGIMNGIDAVVIATGNDWRAVEAGAHAYAARDGRYTSLSVWSVGKNGELIGELELPLAVGIIGGATRVHPVAKAALQMLDVTSASDLAKIIVSVGLAQNLAALRALASEGIQRGHMSLHARQVAISAGAEGEKIQVVADQMVEENIISVERAQELLGSD